MIGEVLKTLPIFFYLCNRLDGKNVLANIMISTHRDNEA